MRHKIILGDFLELKTTIKSDLFNPSLTFKTEWKTLITMCRGKPRVLETIRRKTEYGRVESPRNLYTDNIYLNLLK